MKYHKSLLGRFNIFRRGHFYVGAGVLWLPNAEVIVDNGVLRTAADAGLSRIWVEIYSGGKMRGLVEKLERCEHEGVKEEVEKEM